ncbi:serine protease inhibitor Cvsi-1-like [Saccostrea cucullata]|uniref:serine protease inhibitor Cvsi-1-like n=1 Tax=Saccostrea cuccullata TaxID=36930 RepID=UPI002ED5D2D1
MKVLFIGTLVIFCVSIIAERCKVAQDCQFTSCSSNSSHIACHGYKCTCDASIPCSSILDCIDIGRCHEDDSHYHCLDNKCACLKDKDIPSQ